ncbi:hypothetical protein BN8_06105 [Fibrisoma limi BUZ 3]|uniref:Uncharacterized protein n=1 Tax=Fibrisoma limi BUZ 3 TaxID=1185876 RepID=I2GS44_9BACT|nr:hypothetical protein [Fibrisoma limi]CCH56722.1 hypothetical protein BN8_06105 [Fibrisoma limi BUZ 3]
METIQTAFDTFADTLRDAAARRQFVRLEYMTDLHEFIKADVLLKSATATNGVDVLELANGEQVPFNRVVSISGQLSPRYPGYGNYSCDC